MARTRSTLNALKQPTRFHLSSHPAFISAVSSGGRSFERKNLATLSIAALSLVVSACGSSSGSASTNTSGAASKAVTTTTTTPPPVALTASEPSWQLRNPLSRMVLLPTANNELAILGGLTAADTSASGIFQLNPTNGSLTALGALPAAVHDAAGAVIGSSYVVMGGGSVSTVASVEAAPSGGGNGKVIGELPQPRSDLSAVSVNGEIVIVGGYNGSIADTAVLATSDGVSYKTVSTLKVPVRYPALAAIGGSVYVFGGLSVGGSNPGQPLAGIQKIDISTGAATVVGSLPVPLEGAMAFVLNGHIYLAGGDTGTGSNLVSNAAVWSFQPGSGFSQVATLPLAVSNAGVAVSAGAVWIVGGEHNGKATAVVQTLREKSAAGSLPGANG